MLSRVFISFASLLILGSVLLSQTAFSQDTDVDVSEFTAALADAQEPDGRWPDISALLQDFYGEFAADTYEYDEVMTTAQAVQALIDYAVSDDSGLNLDRPTPFHPEYDFNEHVRKGFRFLFRNGELRLIADQPVDGPTRLDPDTNDNASGICFNCGDSSETVATSIVLTTLCQAVDIDIERVGRNAGTFLPEWTYADVARDTFDYLAFGQNDEGPNVRGSWGPQANNPPEVRDPGSSDDVDTTPSAFAALAIERAGLPLPDGCGFTDTPFIDVHDVVLAELEMWNAGLGAAPVTDFADKFKECPGGWKEPGDRRGGPYPACFQLTEDITYDLKDTFLDLDRLPCLQDPRWFALIAPTYCLGHRQNRMLRHTREEMPPNGETIEPKSGQKPMFVRLERDSSGEGGLLTIKKGFRWDGPTPPLRVSRPDDYRETFMRGSAFHDALYDLMRGGYVPRDSRLISNFNDGFRNQLVADNTLHRFLFVDKNPGDALIFWLPIRLGGNFNTDDDLPLWKYHTVAEAGPDQNFTCVEPEGVDVTLNAGQSYPAVDSYTWIRHDGDLSVDIENVTSLFELWNLLLDLFSEVYVDTGQEITQRILPADSPYTFGVWVAPPDTRAQVSSSRPDDLRECSPYCWDYDTVEIRVLADKEPPVITSAEDIEVTTIPDSPGAVVSFDVSALDNCSTPTISCTRQSGDHFRMGITPVQCTAKDDAGNTKMFAFDVTVKVDDSVHWKTGKVKGGAISWPALTLLTALLILRYSGRRNPDRTM